MIIQSTQRIIDNIRKVANQMDDILRRDLLDAASRLQDQSDLIERMRSELDQAISERTPHDYGILKDQRDSYRDRLCASIKETQEAHAEADRLKAELEKVKLESVKAVTLSFPGMPSSGGGGGGSACGNNHLPDAGKMVRPEPSRLEIATMLYKGMLSSGYVWGDPEKTALRQADALIAAAKEVAK